MYHPTAGFIASAAQGPDTAYLLSWDQSRNLQPPGLLSQSRSREIRYSKQVTVPDSNIYEILVHASMLAMVAKQILLHDVFKFSLHLDHH